MAGLDGLETCIGRKIELGELAPASVGFDGFAQWPKGIVASLRARAVGERRGDYSGRGVVQKRAGWWSTLMKYRNLGQTGIRVSPYALGTLMFATQGPAATGSGSQSGARWRGSGGAHP